MISEKDIADLFIEFIKEHTDILKGKGMVYVGWGSLDEKASECLLVDMDKGSSIEGLPTDYKGVPVVYSFVEKEKKEELLKQLEICRRLAKIYK